MFEKSFFNICHCQVFSKGTMDAFILRSIYPKLSQCLSEFIINPHQQHLGKCDLTIVTIYSHTVFSLSTD